MCMLHPRSRGPPQLQADLLDHDRELQLQLQLLTHESASNSSSSSSSQSYVCDRDRTRSTFAIICWRIYIRVRFIITLAYYIIAVVVCLAPCPIRLELLT